MTHYDLIVLGSGSAARDGAAKAAQLCDASVALVESTRWGGSCPNVACKPTKAYLVVAELMHDINELAGKLGIEVAPGRVDLARVKARKDTLKKGDAKWMEDLRGAGFDIYEGEAELVDAGTVRVRGDELTAERILIATGSRTAVPPIEGIDDVSWIDHVSALDLTELPESMLVVGGGPVGLEFAQIFARFGTRVTIVQGADRISPRSDEDASTLLHAALEDDGIEILVSTKCSASARKEPRSWRRSARRSAASRACSWRRAVRRTSKRCAWRSSASTATAPGILVDERMRTSVEGVWAVGDVTGRYQFTPSRSTRRGSPSTTCSASTTVPRTTRCSRPRSSRSRSSQESASPRREARDQGVDHGTVTHDIKHVQRSSFKEQKRGLYKIVYETGTRRVLGLHVVAPNAGEIVQGFSLGLRLGATVDDLAAMHHVFPTFGEGVKAAAEQAMPQPVEMAAICN